MQAHRINKTLSLGLSMAIALMATTTASASGSMPSARAPISSSQNSDRYDQGKTIYMEKISCNTCPVAEGVSDSASAKALLMRVDANEFKLTKTEKRRLKVFLNRRFKSQ